MEELNNEIFEAGSNEELHEEKDVSAELEALKFENSALLKELEERKNLSMRLENEIGEFSEMFPEVSLSEIPEKIWNEVKRGLPLSASYARHERRISLARKKAAEINNAAREMSSGSISGGSDNYLSPEEVRKMTPGQVKENYTHIINSMKHWN